MPFQKVLRLYKDTALLLLNTLMLFLGLNGIIWTLEFTNLVRFKAPKAPPETSLLPVREIGPWHLGFDKLRRVYPDLTDPEIVRLILESSNLPFVCDADTLYREKPFHGHQVTIDPAGFRWGQDQAPWPPHDDAFNIFVFGGSTTFGSGEANGRTIPSFLQQYLRSRTDESVAVYNFGHRYFFSLQEKWAFEALVREGQTPDLAIFVDGLNEFFMWNGEPTYFPSAYLACDGPGERLKNTVTCREDELCWPVQRLAASLGAQIEARAATATRSDGSMAPPAKDDVATNRAVIERWLVNKSDIERVAHDHQVRTLFVVQPVPTYAYDLTYNLMAKDLADLEAHLRSHWGYGLWEELIATDAGRDAAWTRNCLNLARLGENKTASLYIDRVHYTAAFMKEIAQAIGESVLQRGWGPR